MQKKIIRKGYLFDMLYNMYLCYWLRVGVSVMVFNATFNNISAISWRSVDFNCNHIWVIKIFFILENQNI